jgi:hypothetical protein
MAKITLHKPLAADLLDGAEAFAKFIYGKADQRTVRRVYHELEQGYWPHTKFGKGKRGGRIIGRKSLVAARLSKSDGAGQESDHNADYEQAAEYGEAA